MEGSGKSGDIARGSSGREISAITQALELACSLSHMALSRLPRRGSVETLALLSREHQSYDCDANEEVGMLLIIDTEWFQEQVQETRKRR